MKKGNDKITGKRAHWDADVSVSIPLFMLVKTTSVFDAVKHVWKHVHLITIIAFAFVSLIAFVFDFNYCFCIIHFQKIFQLCKITAVFIFLMHYLQYCSMNCL